MYSLNSEKYFYDVSDGVGILIDFTTGTYYSLNRIGTAIFDKVISGAPPSVLAENLSKIDNCPTDIEDTIKSYISSLSDKGILTEDNTKSSEFAPFTVEDVSEGFIPSADEFNEVQDLIMADPVHDVDQEMGWPKMKSN